MNKAVSRLAMRDISEYLRKNNQIHTKTSEDRFIVSVNEVFSKESVKLNRELGIHNINYKGRKRNDQTRRV